MKSEALRLLKRRLTRKNSLDGWFLLTFTIVIVGLSEAWLASINDDFFLELAIAGVSASITQAPVFIAGGLVYAHLRSGRVKVIWQFILLGIGNLMYTIVFYSLSPAELSNLFTGLVLGWLNQWVAVSYLFLIYVFVTGSIQEFREISENLRDSRKRLEIFEASVDQTVELEEMRLRSKVKEALMPAVREISELVAARGALAVAVVAKIEDTVKNTVKPLGFELRKQLDTDITIPLEKSARISAWGSIPAKFNPRSTISPGLSVLFFAPVLLSASLTVSNEIPIALTLVQVISAWLLIHLLRQLLPKSKLPSVLALCLQQAVVWLATGTSSFLGGLITPQSEDHFSFLLQAAPLISLASLIFTYLALTEISMGKARLFSDQLDTRLEEAQAVFAQRLWVAKRNWSYLVHGKVQSHLLAAKLLASGNALNIKDLDTFREHLNTVMQILRNPPRPDADLLSEIADLETTWRGVAKLKFNLENNALQILEKNAGLRFAVNEILREATSNAVKHSSASEVLISVRATKNELQIEVLNNGVKQTRQASASLGSLMLDELTKTWSLKFSKDDSQTRLMAKLALA